MVERLEPSDTINELLRVYWKADQFRNVVDVFHKIDYQTMQSMYDDYDCWLDYEDFIELFPYLDRVYTSAMNEKIASNRKKGAK